MGSSDIVPIKKLSVSAVKTMQGRDGEVLNCNLVVNGKKVAFCSDDGNG